MQAFCAGRRKCVMAVALGLALTLVACSAWARAQGPASPSDVLAGGKPVVVVLGAPWCQWCKVLEAEVLPAPEVRRVLKARYRLEHVNVDRFPVWMDQPGVDGLPALLFFDRSGRHVLTKTGYRPAPDLVDLLTAEADLIDSGKAVPYGAVGLRVWRSSPITYDAALTELDRLVNAIWLRMDSNTGGFGGPAHDPRPEILEEVAGLAGNNGRFQTAWLDATILNSLRGGSPRLRGEGARDMDFSVADLRRLSRKGKRARRWREAIDRLPTADAYLGLQDPWDYGVFRYAAGPGWYNPHFERRAEDNLAWAMTLRRLGRVQDAERIEAYVLATFADGPLLNSAQASDPFYFRLSGRERAGLPTPKVARLWTLDVQARAAQLWPERCAQLGRVDVRRWPKARWTRNGEDERGPDALPDAVGELLIAMRSCPDQRGRALVLADVVIARWKRGLPDNGRLHRLATGICRAAPARCPEALATVEGMALDLEHAPALRALSRTAALLKPRPRKR